MQTTMKTVQNDNAKSFESLDMETVAEIFIWLVADNIDLLIKAYLLNCALLMRSEMDLEQFHEGDSEYQNLRKMIDVFHKQKNHYEKMLQQYQKDPAINNAIQPYMPSLKKAYYTPDEVRELRKLL